MTLLAISRLNPMLAEERALAGDSAAWNELVARHERRVLLSIVARRVPLDVAREIAQQTWLKLYEIARAGELDAVELPGLAIRQADYLLTRPKKRSLGRVMIAGDLY